MKDLDKVFKSRIGNYASELPEGLWDKIELQLEQPVKNRNRWIYFMFGFLFLCAVLIGIPSLNQKNDLTITSLESSEKKEELERIDQNEIKHQEIRESGPTLYSDVLTSESTISSSTIKAKSFSESEISKSNLIEGSEKNIEEFVEPTADLNQLIILDENSKRGKIEIKNKIKYSFLDLNQLKSLEMPVRKFNDPIGCPTFESRPPLNIFIEGHFNSIYSLQLLSSNSPEIGQQYLNSRRETESPLYSWNGAFHIGWLSDKNIGFKTGALFESINERFYFEDPEAIRNQTVITIDTFFNPDGSFNVVSDTSVIQVTGFEAQSIHNYHKTVEIPIHFIYQVDMDRLDIEISGGPNFNINYTNRGKILDPSNEDRWFTNGPNGDYRVFRDRLSVSLSLAIGLMYNTGENFQLYLRPNVKFHPSSMALENSPFNQRYANFGVAVGARYYLNGNPNY